MREENGYELLTAEVIKSLCKEIKELEEKRDSLPKSAYQKRIAIGYQLVKRKEWLEWWLRPYRIDSEYLLKQFNKGASK